MHKNGGNLSRRRLTGERRLKGSSAGLAVSGNGTQLPGKEVVRGPGAADGHFAVLELLGRGAVTVLVFLNRLGIDEMGDVDEHALGRNLLAAHFLFERIKQLMNLHREGAGLGLALAVAGSLDAQFGEIVAADSVGQDDIDHGFAQRAVGDHQLDVHLGLAPEPFDAQAEGAPVYPDGLAEGVVALENGSEAEGQHGGIAEAAAHYAGVLDGGFLIELGRVLVEFAHNHSKLAAGIAEDWGSVHALNILDYERASGTGAVRKGLVLGKAVRVPRHIKLSEPGRRWTYHLLSCFSQPAELRVLEFRNERYRV